MTQTNTISTEDLESPDFRAGYLHAVVCGTNWSDEVREQLDTILRRSLNDETRQAYEDHGHPR